MYVVSRKLFAILRAPLHHRFVYLKYISLLQRKLHCKGGRFNRFTVDSANKQSEYNISQEHKLILLLKYVFSEELNILTRSMCHAM
jgi:hypothetical protein